MARNRNDRSGQLTFTHLIVTALFMLVIGYIIGRLSFGVSAPRTQPAAVTPSAAPVAATPDFSALEQRARGSSTAGAWTTLGDAYFDSGRYQDAVDAYSKSIELDPANPNVWTDRGIMYRRLGNPGAAISDFERASAIDPTHVMSRFNRGIVLNYDLGETDAALAAFSEVLAIDPNFVTPSGVLLRDFVESLR